MKKNPRRKLLIAAIGAFVCSSYVAVANEVSFECVWNDEQLFKKGDEQKSADVLWKEGKRYAAIKGTLHDVDGGTLTLEGSYIASNSQGERKITLYRLNRNDLKREKTAGEELKQAGLDEGKEAKYKFAKFDNKPPALREEGVELVNYNYLSIPKDVFTNPEISEFKGYFTMYRLKIAPEYLKGSKAKNQNVKEQLYTRRGHKNCRRVAKAL